MEGGVKTVYGACQEKPERYRFWVNLGFVAIDPDCMLLSAHLLQADRVPNTFSAIGKEHSIHRRRIAGVYTKSYIQQQPYVPAIAHHLLGQLLPHFQHAVQKQRALDVLNLIIGYGLDFVSAYTWGIPQATNFVEDAESRRAWLTGYLTSHPDDYLFWLLDGRTLRSFLEKFRLKPVPERVGQARARLEQWVLNKIDQTEQSMRSSKVDPSSGDYPVVYHHIQTAIAKEGSKVGSLQLPDHYSATRVQLASECLDNLVAARDVFGISFSFVIYEIARHPDAQERLRQELLSALTPVKLPLPSDCCEMPSPKDLESLPLLNAVIKESLRLHGTQPVSHPRLTPHGRQTKVGSYDGIPGGVRINTFPWCIHRNKDVFPDCESWRPERWLGQLGNQAEQEKLFWTFGSGSRMCVGNHLSMEMMRYAVAFIHINYVTSLKSNTGFFEYGGWVTARPGDSLSLNLKFANATSADK